MARTISNVTTTWVNSVLGTNHKDVKSLCLDPGINMWSRYKPVEFISTKNSESSKIEDSSRVLEEVDFKNTNYGIKISSGAADSPYADYTPALYEKVQNCTDTENKLWKNSYVKPTKFFRLGDFDGYSAYAEFPYIVSHFPDDTSSGSNTSTVKMTLENISTDHTIPFENMEMEGTYPTNTWHMGVIYKHPSGNVYSQWDSRTLEEIASSSNKTIELYFDITTGTTKGFAALGKEDVTGDETGQFLYIPNSDFEVHHTKTGGGGGGESTGNDPKPSDSHSSSPKANIAYTTYPNTSCSLYYENGNVVGIQNISPIKVEMWSDESFPEPIPESPSDPGYWAKYKGDENLAIWVKFYRIGEDPGYGYSDYTPLTSFKIPNGFINSQYDFQIPCNFDNGWFDLNPVMYAQYKENLFFGLNYNPVIRFEYYFEKYNEWIEANKNVVGYVSIEWDFDHRHAFSSVSTSMSLGGNFTVEIDRSQIY